MDVEGFVSASRLELFHIVQAESSDVRLSAQLARFNSCRLNHRQDQALIDNGEH